LQEESSPYATLLYTMYCALFLQEYNILCVFLTALKRLKKSKNGKKFNFSYIKYKKKLTLSQKIEIRKGFKNYLVVQYIVVQINEFLTKRKLS